MIDSVGLGIRIHNMRTAYGWSGVFMADKLGIDQSYLSKIERGKHCPNLKLLVTIAILLDVSLDWLVFGGVPDAR